MPKRPVVRWILSSAIGGVGKGLELTLKSLQVSRTLIPAYSLGAADTGLRVVLDFAQHVERQS